MKIVLRAFGDKLSGVMEVPEETGSRFRLAMTQPIQMMGASYPGGKELPMMDSPIQAMVTFEWTGKTFSQKDHAYDGAREYQLISIK